MSKILNAVLITIFNGLVYCWRIKNKPSLYIGLALTCASMFYLKKVTDTNWGMVTTISPFIIYLFLLGIIAGIKKNRETNLKTYDENNYIEKSNVDEIYPAAVERTTERIIFIKRFKDND